MNRKYTREEYLQRIADIKRIIPGCGTFTLDYAHTTPTYGLPGGKWVMSALTVDDGIHDDGPVMTTAFEYKDGKRVFYTNDCH